MIKVFLAEDEYIIREGIKNNIDWTSHGYIFVGEAADGELAYPMICKLKPDIVITDIKMPFMNGLELSRLIRKELPETEIIILSGYEEFEYAKEAIRIGVAEYLLKPISGDELLDHIGQIASRIEEKRREKEMYAQYRREMEDNFTKERRDLFDNLVTGTQSVTVLMEQAEKLGIDITSITYNILLFKCSSTKHEQNEFSTSLVNIDNALDELGSGRNLILFDRDPEGKAVLFMADSTEELAALQNEYISDLKKLLEGYHNIRYFGGIGTPAARITELPESFESAGRAFAHRYLTEDSRITSCTELLSTVHTDGFNISEVNPKQIDRSKIRDFLKAGDIEETRFFVGEFYRELGTGAVNSFLFRQYIAMDAYFCVSEFVESLGGQRDGIETIASDGSTLSDADSAIAYTCRILEQALEIRDSVARNRYGSIVESVVEYIENNYSDDDLAISSIAAHVNFSPNHLSTVFRQETGQTLIKYLTDFRLGKAKEMLKCTSLRSSEIGSKCGYKDPHYFSYLFKKTFGMTPTQYREGQ